MVLEQFQEISVIAVLVLVLVVQDNRAVGSAVEVVSDLGVVGQPGDLRALRVVGDDLDQRSHRAVPRLDVVRPGDVDTAGGVGVEDARVHQRLLCGHQLDVTDCHGASTAFLSCHDPRLISLPQVAALVLLQVIQSCEALLARNTHVGLLSQVFPHVCAVRLPMNKIPGAELTREGRLSAVRSEVPVQILLGSAAFGTIHAAKLLHIAVTLYMVLEIRKLLKLFATNTTSTFQSTLMIVVNDFQMSYQVLLGSTDGGAVNTAELLLNSVSHLDVTFEIFHQGK